LLPQNSSVSAQTLVGKMAEDLFGKFTVRSYVSGSSGQTTKQSNQFVLAIGATTGEHMVEVENTWTTVPYDIEVDASLPQQKHLSFSGASGWQANIDNLAKDETESDKCGIDCLGTIPGSERIHCGAVRWRKAGRHYWNHATANLPLTISVSIV